jgi:hypothetical protein
MATNTLSSTVKFAPLSLDFAKPSQLHSATKSLGLVLLIAGAIGLAFAAVQLKQTFDARTTLQQRNSELSARVQTLKDQANATRSRKTDVADPQDVARTRAAKQVATELQMPWSDLLSAFEAAPTQDIAVLSIEPSAARRSVKVTAEAKHAQAMLRYLSALQKDKRLTQVMLIQHQVQQQVAGTPLRFQLQAYWGGGFAGAPEVVPALMTAEPENNSNKPLMANNAAQSLPQSEQNTLAQQMNIRPAAPANAVPAQDLAARSPRN